MISWTKYLGTVLAREKPVRVKASLEPSILVRTCLKRQASREWNLECLWQPVKAAKVGPVPTAPTLPDRVIDTSLLSLASFC
jgi:hypothetical protein